MTRSEPFIVRRRRDADPSNGRFAATITQTGEWTRAERGDTSRTVSGCGFQTSTIRARVAGTALDQQGATTAMPRRRVFKKPDTWEYGHDAPADEKPLAQPGKRRAATMLVYGALFFAGAAFTAFAGDRFAQMSSGETAASAETTTDTAAPADAAAPATDATAAPAPAADPAAAPSDAAAAAAAPADAAPADTSAASADPNGVDDLTPNRTTSSSGSATASDASASGDGSSAGAPAGSGGHKPARGKNTAAASPFVLLPKVHPAPKPELEGPPAYSTVWLNRALPDPTPPALRLSPKFARRLSLAAQSSGVDWALVLGVLRAKGATGHTPANGVTLNRLADRLASMQKSAGGEWATALAYDGAASFADRALALARYDRAVGMYALVHGLEAAKTRMAQRLLSDPAVSIYGGGRDDIIKGKVDVRVLAVIAYLKESFGSVTVSCLVSGHRLYARPGVISAHIYGRASDISALGGTPIQGHQEPGGLTEQAVRDLLLLPTEVMPKQVISLLGLGGPSFPLANHYNHIHIGF
jgi:hypothetical protein